MTTRESKRGWLALVPKGTVRFSTTGGGSNRRKTDESESLSYVGDHCILTDAGEKFFYTYCGRYF